MIERACRVHDYLGQLLGGRSLYLLFSLLLLFALDPLLSQGNAAIAVWELLLTLVTLTSIYTLGLHLHHARIAGVLAVPVVVSLWAGFFIAGSQLDMVVLTLTAVFLIYTVTVVLFRVLSADTVTVDTISGALCAYLLLGVIWATMYALLYSVSPGAFSLADAIGPGEVLSEPPMHLFLYFSFITQTTVGYGDIEPANALARSLAVLQAIIGQFYLAVLVARLVSQQVSRPNGKPDS
jgi:hypothetical protein